MTASTENRLLDEAQKLVQLGGFHGFSYADLSEAVGIRKPSIHYYFPAKQDLGLALIRRYRRQLQQGLAWVNSSSQDAQVRLSLYIRFFAGVVQDGKLCLCTALAADTQSLSEATQAELQAAIADKLNWLEQVFCAKGAVNAAALAKNFLATVEGAMLLARANRSLEVYNEICQKLLEE